MGHTSIKAKMLQAFRLRMYFFVSIVGLIFLVMIMQVINLQLIHGYEYTLKAKLNMENKVPIPASRGEIYDRNFTLDGNRTVLVSNRPSFNLITIPAKFKPKEISKPKEAKLIAHQRITKTINELAKLIHINAEEVIRDISSRNSYERVVIKEDVSFETIIKIASHQHKFPNIEWEDAPVRVYNYKNMFAHAIGYIGSITKDEYKNLRNHGYKHYQKIGKSGIEKQYDKSLKGNDGFILRIVDVKNRIELEEPGDKSQAGESLVLTIDYDLQKTAYDAMGNVKGAVIVMRPSTGEILTLVSKPDFDPNQVISKDNSEILNTLYSDKSNKPFLNRAIQSRFPPASTFKLVTAIAGLETDKAVPSRSHHCPGKYTLRGYKDKDFYCYEVHGTVDLYWAIARSCSVYFYYLGYNTGPTSILKYARYFGLNEKTGIDIPGEISGFLPSKKWKLKTYGPWYDGDTLNLSIGQGFLSVTPMEMACFISGIVNNGIIYKPYLLKERRSTDNRTVLYVAQKEKIKEIPLSPLTLNTIKKGMRMAATSGTCYFMNNLKVPVTGKTGTAQLKSKRDAGLHHAWYVGFAPYEGSPEKSVVVVAFVEEGGYGADRAAPIGYQIYSKLYDLGYFK